jgi:hypothetical protein
MFSMQVKDLEAEVERLKKELDSGDRGGGAGGRSAGAGTLGTDGQPLSVLHASCVI